MCRRVEEFFRHEQRDERHDLEVGLERLELGQHFRRFVRGRLHHFQTGSERGFLQRIDLGAFFFWRNINGDDFFVAFEQRFQHRLAEGLLAVDHDTHIRSLPVI